MNTRPPTARVRPKLAFVVQKGMDQFLDDLVAGLSTEYETRRFVVEGRSKVDEALAWADCCWFEWCNEPLVYATTEAAATGTRIVARIHRYETFTAFPSQVNWSRVDRLMLVTPHLGEILSETVPGISNRVPIEVISNGVALDRFPYEERQAGHQLAYIGYIHPRKNPTLLLQIMSELVKVDSRYRLSVAGTFQDPVLQLYWSHMVREMGLEANVILDGWQNDMANWLSDKQYVLATTVHESFGYGIAEAMARGIKPVVHHFVFAREIWPEEMLFSTIREAVDMITTPEYASADYRAFIERQYSLERQLAATRRLLQGVMAEGHKKTDPTWMPGPLAIG